jgi:hypothetical protein
MSGSHSDNLMPEWLHSRMAREDTSTHQKVGFVVLEGRVLFRKLFEGFVNRFLPEPVEILEGNKEKLNFVFGSLDRSCKEQDNFHDFLVLGDHLIKRCLFVGFSVLLLPVKQVLRAS